MKKLMFIFILLIIPMIISHQPRVISNTDEIIQIEDPEISKAYYAELTGKPDYYQIKSDKPFKLYLGILVPAIPNIDKDVSAEISLIKKHGHEKDEEHFHEDEKELLYLLDGLNSNWTYFYEEYAGDEYYSGPELREGNEIVYHPQGLRVRERIYEIKIFSPDNRGKYILAVGQIEKFPLNEIAKTVFTMPQLKKYFEKSPLLAFQSPFMIGYLVITLIIIFVPIIILYFIIKKYIKMK